jgi:uncharacterized protein YciI
MGSRGRCPRATNCAEYAAEEDEEMPALYMVLRRYGPPHQAGKPLEQQAEWEAHRVFMNDLEARGAVRLAGPLEGGEDVLLVFRADSAEEIEKALAADPWTTSGILATTRIERWLLRMGRVE